MRLCVFILIISACTEPGPAGSELCRADLAVDGRDVIAWQLPVAAETVTVNMFAQYAVGVQCWLIPPGDDPVTVFDRIVYGTDSLYQHTDRYAGGVLMCSGLDEWIRYRDPVVTCADSL